MLAALVLILFGLSSALKNERLRLLKESWKHENYTSFDHFWESEWGTDELRPMTPVMKMIEEQRIECKLAGLCPQPKADIIGNPQECVNGNAGGYECDGINLLAFVSLSSLGSSNSADGNDIWGYTNSAGEMFAITGQTDGASIVEVTDPTNPIVLVFIQSRVATNTVWRDMKVYNGFVYIVADRSGQGIQTVNLDNVIAAARAGSARPYRITRGSSAYATYVHETTTVSNTHNIVLNEGSGYAYCVGSSLNSGGFAGYDVSGSNGQPVRGRSFSADGYTHDGECVRYHGPDNTYNGRDICFGYNENSLTIVDIATGAMISRQGYSQSAYTHQGWLTDDHRFLLMNDELDESRFGINTRTLIWDVRSLSNPTLAGTYFGPTSSIDHNLYIDGSLAYEANYKAGLRVLDISTLYENNPVIDNIDQVAFFKTWTSTINAQFNGAWSVYPYFATHSQYGVFVVVQDIEQGLFILQMAI